MTEHPRSDAERARLAKEYPDWLIGLSRQKGLVDACWFQVPETVVLTDPSYAGLGKRIAKFRAVFNDTGNPHWAEAEANRLKTTEL